MSPATTAFHCEGTDTVEIIAHIQTDFPQKFGIPRQSGLANSLIGRIVFEPAYRNEAAVRGLEEFSHIWLLWQFQDVERNGWSPTVRPPRLGGNTRMGVFATRSPFRPNPIGLSSVELDHIALEDEGPVLYVRGADLRDGTPIYDIKPYLPEYDSHPDAVGGFTDSNPWQPLKVVLPDELAQCLPAEKVAGLVDALAQDPRPAYKNDSAQDAEQHIYKMAFAGFDIAFTVDDSAALLQVVAITAV